MLPTNFSWLQHPVSTGCAGCSCIILPIPPASISLANQLQEYNVPDNVHFIQYTFPCCNPQLNTPNQPSRLPVPGSSRMPLVLFEWHILCLEWSVYGHWFLDSRHWPSWLFIAVSSLLSRCRWLTDPQHNCIKSFIVSSSLSSWRNRLRDTVQLLQHAGSGAAGCIGYYVK